MRLYGSIRLPFLKAFSPRVGFISERIGGRSRPTYNARQIDATTLLRGGSAEFEWGWFWFGVLLGGVLLAGLLYLVLDIQPCHSSGSCVSSSFSFCNLHILQTANRYRINTCKKCQN